MNNSAGMKDTSLEAEAALFLFFPSFHLMQIERSGLRLHIRETLPTPCEAPTKGGLEIERVNGRRGSGDITSDF